MLVEEVRVWCPSKKSHNKAYVILSSRHSRLTSFVDRTRAAEKRSSNIASMASEKLSPVSQNIVQVLTWAQAVIRAGHRDFAKQLLDVQFPCQASHSFA